MDEPALLITPNAAAMKLLGTLLDDEEREGEIGVWTTTIPLTITRADLYRVMYGNGDLARIGFWVDQGVAEAVAFPDPETPMEFCQES